MIHNQYMIKDSQDILITVPDGSLQEEADITDSFIIELSNKKKNIKSDALLHLKYVSLPTKISIKNTPIIYIAISGFDFATELNIFRREDDNQPSKYSKHSILGTINHNSIPNWKSLKTYNSRVSIPLAHNTPKFSSDYFVLRSFFDLQNTRFYLIDENGDKLIYGKATTKRPHFTLSIDYYSE